MATRSPAFNHFAEPEAVEGGKGIFKARCKHCKKEVSIKGKSSSNLITHLKRYHVSIHNTLYTQPSTTQEASISTFTGFSVQAQSVKKWKSSDGGKQKDITDAIISFVASDLQPLSVVESLAFRQILEKAEPRYTVPSRKHLSRQLIPKRFSDSFTKLVGLLKNAKQVCLTLDLWTNRQMRSYLGVTVHFITDFRLMSAMLACCRFYGSHTGEDILQHFIEIEQKFEIAGKVDNIVTDNGSNMLKAFRLLDEENDLDDTDSDSAESDNEELEPTEISSDELDSIKPTHYSCLAHTLQLVVKDGMANAERIKRVLSKVSKLVSHVRHSTVASDLFEGENRLQAANATRSNSQLTMLKSLLDICNSSAMQRLDYAGKLNTYEITIIRDLVEILTPFKWATDLTQGQNVVTASYILPVIRGLKVQTDTLSQKFKSPLTKQLKSSLHSRMEKYDLEEIFRIAAVLDPRWKTGWCSTEEEVSEMKSIIIEKGRCFRTINTTEESASLSQQSTSGSEPPKKKSKLFEFMNNTGVPAVQLQSDNVTTELEEYLSSETISEDDNPLIFWKSNCHRYPILSKLACCYLQTPASSGPVERLFSIAEKMFRPDRCRLSDDIFEKLMFIRSHDCLFDKD